MKTFGCPQCGEDLTVHGAIQQGEEIMLVSKCRACGVKAFVNVDSILNAFDPKPEPRKGGNGHGAAH